MIRSVCELMPGAAEDRFLKTVQQSVHLPPTAARRLKEEARRVGMSVSEMNRFCILFFFEHLDEARRIMEPAPESVKYTRP